MSHKYTMFVYVNKQIEVVGMEASKLEEYGLRASEALVYVLLLKQGPQTVLAISRFLSLDRSKVYRVIEQLRQRKLIEHSQAGWGKKIKAAPAENLALLVQAEVEQAQAKQENIASIISELQANSFGASAGFEIKNYVGKDGLRQMFWNQLAAPDRKILCFSHLNRNAVVGKKFAETIRAEQIKKQIMLYEVENDTEQDDEVYTKLKGWEKFYKLRTISPALCEIKHHVAISGHTVSIINWLEDGEVGVEIINESFAKMQRQLFQNIWNQGSDFQDATLRFLHNGKG